MELKLILNWISEAEDHELTEVAEAMIRRQKKLHPDWECMYISFPLKQEKMCRQILCSAWEMLRKSAEYRGDASGWSDRLREETKGED